jgi:hypothetical protein
VSRGSTGCPWPDIFTGSIGCVGKDTSKGSTSCGGKDMFRAESSDSTGTCSKDLSRQHSLLYRNIQRQHIILLTMTSSISVYAISIYVNINSSF